MTGTKKKFSSFGKNDQVPPYTALQTIAGRTGPCECHTGHLYTGPCEYLTGHLYHKSAWSPLGGASLTRENGPYMHFIHYCANSAVSV